ncbi:hypothetical protein HPB50_001104 [Hyalomma asiaticum]|uniref:Uncharacterized protein n=1 Tax=Hyalomma asiaticum TaxID=266040 RepID=A0ACB7S0N9_HYAAI|nr:hypothetical protein HPB50_001104 [Hyalomma asiaticum]
MGRQGAREREKYALRREEARVEAREEHEHEMARIEAEAAQLRAALQQSELAAQNRRSLSSDSSVEYYASNNMDTNVLYTEGDYGEARTNTKCHRCGQAPRQLKVLLKKPRVLDARRFRITADSECDVVTNAIRRYRKLVLMPTEYAASEEDEDSTETPTVMLTRLRVSVRRDAGIDCGFPPPKANESYVLKIPTRGDAFLSSETVWGALRGEVFTKSVTLLRNFALPHQL